MSNAFRGWQKATQTELQGENARFPLDRGDGTERFGTPDDIIAETITGASLTDTTLTLTRADGDNPVSITIPDGFTSASFASGTLTLGRTAGADVEIDLSSLTGQTAAQVSAAITAAISELFTGASISGRTLTLTRADGENPLDVLLPNGITGASLNGNTLVLTRVVGANLEVDLSSLAGSGGGGGQTAGQVSAAISNAISELLVGVTLSGRTLTFARQDGANALDVELPNAVTGASLNGTDLVLSFITGTDSTVDLSSLVGSGGGGLSQSQVTALITSAIAGHLTGVSISDRVLSFTVAGAGSATEITIPTPTATEIGASMRARSVGSPTPVNADEVWGWDASTSEPVRFSAAHFLAASGGDGSDPSDTWASQFSILPLAATTIDDATGIAAGSTSASEDSIELSGSVRQDEAQLGLDHNTGDIEFANLHLTRTTRLITRGLVPLFIEPVSPATATPACDLQIFLQGIDTNGNETGPEILVAEHGIAAQTARHNFEVTLGPSVFRAMRGTSAPLGGTRYRLRRRLTPRTAVPTGGMRWGVQPVSEDSHLVSWERWTGAFVPAPDATRNEGDTLKTRSGVPVWEYEPDLPDSVPAPLRGVPVFPRVTVGPGPLFRPVISYEPLGDFSGARSVATLAVAPLHAGDQVRLTALDGSNYPGLYLAVATTLTRNEARGTIGNRQVVPQQGSPAVTEYGWSRAASPNGYGVVLQGGAYVAKASWLTFEGATPFNIFVHSSIAASRPTLYAEVRSSETSTIVGTDFQRTTGRLVVGGQTFFEYQSITPLSNAEVTALANIADASGGNDIQVRLFEDNSGARGNAINFLPAYEWEAYLGQEHLQPFIEEADADRRILRGGRIYRDWPDLGIFDSLTAAATVITQVNAGKTFSVQNRAASGNARLEIDRYVIRSGFPGTDGTRGATNRRNRFSALLTPFGHGVGQYYTISATGHKRTFDNVQDADRVDPGLLIGAVTFAGEGTANDPIYMNIALSATLTTRNSIFVRVANRETNTGVRVTTGLDLTLTRETGANATSVYEGRTYNNYRVVVQQASLAGLGLQHGWIFEDETFIIDLWTDSGESTPLNVSPDTFEFTAGTGYAAPSDAVAAAAVEIAGGSGGGGATLSVANARFNFAATAAAALTGTRTAGSPLSGELTTIRPVMTEDASVMGDFAEVVGSGAAQYIRITAAGEYVFHYDDEFVMAGGNNRVGGRAIVELLDSSGAHKEWIIRETHYFRAPEGADSFIGRSTGRWDITEHTGFVTVAANDRVVVRAVFGGLAGSTIARPANAGDLRIKQVTVS